MTIRELIIKLLEADVEREVYLVIDGGKEDIAIEDVQFYSACPGNVYLITNETLLVASS